MASTYEPQAKYYAKPNYSGFLGGFLAGAVAVAAGVYIGKTLFCKSIDDKVK